MDFVERRRLLDEKSAALNRQLRELEEEQIRGSTKIPINRGGISTPPRYSVLGTPSPTARGASPSPLPPMTAAPLMQVVVRPGHEEYRAVDGSEVQRVDHAGPADNVTERWYTSPDGAVKEYERHRQAPGLEEHMRNEESHFATPNSESWNKVQSSSSSYVGGGGSPAALMPFEHQDPLKFHQQAVDRAMKQAHEQMNWASHSMGGGLSHAAFPAFSGIGGFPAAGGGVADIHARAVQDAERSMQDMMRRSQEQMNQMMRTHQQTLDRSLCVPSPSHIY